MVTTVTTSTVTISTIVSTIAVMGLTVSIGMVAVVGLIAFLAAKELIIVNSSSSFLRIARFLNVGILPLVMAFTVIVAVAIIGAIG